MNISDDIKNDFSKGSVKKHIVRLAVPMTVAMLVQMLYNLVDRIYIGHLPEDSANAFTGLGLTFPIVTLVLAFTNLFGTGGAPLCSIDRGRHETAHAEKIMGNTFTALLGCSLLVMALCYPLMKPILYLFGASDATYPYAAEYLNIYLIGTPLVMLATGMNGFINVQGYTKYGMITVAAGAVVNIALDPLFIFTFGLGVKGAAIATVLSQAVSAAWVLLFLCGKKTTLRLKKQYFKPEARILKSIVALGTTGFVMNASNGAVQIACNATLKSVGGVMLGDMYIGIMTALNSLRDVVSLPIQGLTNASQPVIAIIWAQGNISASGTRWRSRRSSASSTWRSYGSSSSCSRARSFPSSWKIKSSSISACPPCTCISSAFSSWRSNSRGRALSSGSARRSRRCSSRSSAKSSSSCRSPSCCPASARSASTACSSPSRSPTSSEGLQASSR